MHVSHIALVLCSFTYVPLCGEWGALAHSCVLFFSVLHQKSCISLPHIHPTTSHLHSHKIKMAIKRRDLYGPVLHLGRGQRPAAPQKADRREQLAITGGGTGAPGGRAGSMAGETAARSGGSGVRESRWWNVWLVQEGTTLFG